MKQLLHKDFGAAFQNADILVLTDIYSAGEAPIAGVNGQLIADEVLRQTAQKVVYIPKREDVAGYLQSVVQPGDLVMTMGAGDIYKTGEELVELLQK